MINIAEIADPTGSTFMPGDHTNEIGTDSRLARQERSHQTRDILPYKLLAETTGADISECRELLIIIGTNFASLNNITNAYLIVNKTIPTKRKLAEVSSSRSSQEASLSRRKYEIADVVNRLRELSGLDIESLAQIFNVSRVTFHRWLRGLPVSKRHRDYILEILPFLEEATQRLGSPEAVSVWLLTPTSSGGKKPIEYLAEKQYDLFHGFLLHQHTGKEQFRPLKPSGRVFKPRKREEIEDVREQLRPHTWYEENYDLNESND